MATLGTATGNIVINLVNFNQAVQQVQAGSNAMTKALQGIGVGVGFVAVKQLGEMAFELAKDAAQADATREAYNSLAESFGNNADDMLASMRASSKGMISDANLVLDANRAMLLGVADNAQKMGDLLDVARVRGQAMGLTVSVAFERLVTGLGRLSPKILDDLGIKGTQKALDDYAKSIGRTASQLSDAQQQAILFNAVMASTKGLIDASANAGDNATTKFQQFGAKIENSKQKLGDFLLEAGATDTLDTFSTSLDDSITALKELDDWFTQLKTDWDNFANNTVLPSWFSEIDGLLKRWEALEGHLGFVIGTRPDDPYAPKRTAADAGGSGGFTGPSGAASHGPIPVPPSVIDQQAIVDAQVKYSKDLAKINRDTNRDIQQATEQAGRQRAETVRQYELGIVRDEEDFAISRQRQQRDYEQNIVAIMRDEQARETKVRADLDENIAQERADSNKQLARQEEDFQTARARALKDHNDDLLDAAGRLDAAAVYRSQRDFAKQERVAQEDRDKQLKRAAEDQSEREDRERKSAEKQLSEARAADEQRLADMKAALEQQRADEDEDRAKLKTRAADDHQHDLDQQAIEAGLRIQQIIDNAADERTALQAAFDQQLTDLGLFNTAYHNAQLAQQKQAIEDLKPFMADWFKTAREAFEADMMNPEGKRPGQTPVMSSFASGGFVPHDMIARLHAGEYVMPSRAVASMVSNQNNSRSVVVQAGAVVIHAAPGMDEDRLVSLAIDGLIDRLEAA